MTASADDRKGKTIGLLILLMLLGFLATACGGTNTEQANQVEPVDRADLVNPAKYGEEALAKLPEINPPLGVGDPRIVGSQDMTRVEFVQFVVEDVGAMWQASFESSGYVYSPAPTILYDEPMAISGCGGVADPRDRAVLLPGEHDRLLPGLVYRSQRTEGMADRRFRRGLHPGPRVRPPRPEPARHP